MTATMLKTLHVPYVSLTVAAVLVLISACT